MGLTARLAWAPPLAGACKRRHHMEGSDKGRQITREAITKEHWDAGDSYLRGGHDLLGGLERARPHDGGDHQPKLGGKTDPDPLPSILAVRPTFTGRIQLTRLLALDKVPHLVELYLGDRQVPQQVAIDLLGLLGRTPKPAQYRLFRDPRAQS